MQSHKRVVSVTFVNSDKDNQTSTTLTGPAAESFKRQFDEERSVITYTDPTTGNIEMHNVSCICKVTYSNTEGDAYVAPPCEEIFCPKPATTPESNS